jgi:hypothetical protein
MRIPLRSSSDRPPRLVPPTPTTADAAPSDALPPTVRRARRMAGYSQDGFSSSIEMVVTPILFILGGMWIDRRIGTGWIVAAVLGALAIGGTVAKQWYVYDARMKGQERELRLARDEAAAVAADARAQRDSELRAERDALLAHLDANRPAEGLAADLLDRRIA